MSKTLEARPDGTVELVERTPLPGIASIELELSYHSSLGKAEVRVNPYTDPETVLASVRVLAKHLGMECEVEGLVVRP